MTAAVSIRRALPEDAAALLRLAALDSERPLAGSVLLAEADGEPLAALSLSDGRVVADPFRSTEPLVALLRVRGQQVGGAAGGRRRLRRLRTAAQPAR
ncbi:MAG: hypothetical protein M3340_18175 [Actinomycetota bacterium]|nr:hypothetical protein [Actinomycetota bacterium]